MCRHCLHPTLPRTCRGLVRSNLLAPNEVPVVECCLCDTVLPWGNVPIPTAGVEYIAVCLACGLAYHREWGAVAGSWLVTCYTGWEPFGVFPAGGTWDRKGVHWFVYGYYASQP